MLSLKFSLARKVAVAAVIMMMMVASHEVKAATCNSWCGTSAYLDTSVSPTTSEPVTAYYFFNNSYPPSVFLTSNNIRCPVQYSIFNNGQSLTINGIVQSTTDSTSGFIFAMQFTATTTSNPMLELFPNQYVQNGGTVDTSTFSFWQLTTGTLAGYGSYQGVSLAVSEFMHPLQIGRGANGKNLNFGSGAWFSYVNQNGSTIQTDLNVDLTCAEVNVSSCNAATTCSSHGACLSDGSCYCFPGYSGSSCNQCASGYSGYPNCVATCNAATTCSGYGSCAADGSCVCNTGYAGSSCNLCASGYYGYPNCITCDAATTCSGYGSCAANGSCICNIGYTGSSCNQCSSGYSGYPNCAAICNAATTCSGYGSCAADGSCVCLTGYTGSSCNQCASGYTGYPNCALPCTSVSGGIVTTPTSTPVNGANVVSIGYLVAAAAIAAMLFA